MDMEKSFKNIILAGIGTAAMAYEKAMEAVDEMVHKGELTVQQGKELNKELKNKLTNDGNDSNVTFDASTLTEILNQANLATKSDIEDLKNRIEALENQ